MTTSTTPCADTPAVGNIPASAKLASILHPVSIPAIGSVWVGQGGIFVGIVRGVDGQPDNLLIAATEDLADGPWGEYGKEIAGACSYYDGMANTLAMVDAESAIAKACRAYTCDGHTDFCLPSQADLQLMSANIREAMDKSDWYWSSTHYGRNGAFVQDFAYGTSGWYGKDTEYRVRAVRRIQLQPVNA